MKHQTRLIGGKTPDIYASAREEIARTDWAAVHIRSDRSPPVTLPDRIRYLMGRS